VLVLPPPLLSSSSSLLLPEEIALESDIPSTPEGWKLWDLYLIKEPTTTTTSTTTTTTTTTKLMIVIHHSLIDGESLLILGQEICDNMNTITTQPPSLQKQDSISSVAPLPLTSSAYSYIKRYLPPNPLVDLWYLIMTILWRLFW